MSLVTQVFQKSSMCIFSIFRHLLHQALYQYIYTGIFFDKARYFRVKKAENGEVGVACRA